MNKTRGFSVSIFMPAGEPEGLRVIRKSNWSGKGIVFPRSLLREARAQEELHATGVYVLWEPGTSEQLPRAYVGEGDEVIQRLVAHANNKDFWTHCVVFTSMDQSLNKAHIRHIEARLARVADDAKRCKLENGNIPKEPSLSDEDKTNAELYLADVLLCLPLVGVNFFHIPTESSEPNRDLHLKAKGIEATGFEEAGGFVVRAGSGAVKEEVPSIHAYLSALRTTLVNEGVLDDAGEAYKLTQDYVFESPSTAAGVLLGSPSNGRLQWKNSEGKPLKEIQEAEVSEASGSSAAA